MARPEKVAAVADIARRLSEADAALLTEYRGLTVGELADLRTSLRESGTELKVLKNTLARIAARETGMEDLVGLLVGPTAIAFVSGDAAAAAKAIDDATKKYPVLVLKGGVLNGRIIDGGQARELARLEPREVLLAKTAMLFNTPAQQAVNVLAALLRNFGSMLAQVVEKKASGELPGGAGTAAASPDEAPDAGEPPADDSAEGASLPADTATGQVADDATTEDEPATAAPEPAEVATEAVVDEATGQTTDDAAVVPEAVDQSGAAPDATPAEQQDESEE